MHDNTIHQLIFVGELMRVELLLQNVHSIIVKDGQPDCRFVRRCPFDSVLVEGGDLPLNFEPLQLETCQTTSHTDFLDSEAAIRCARYNNTAIEPMNCSMIWQVLMSGVTKLHEVKLTPVIELAPGIFSKHTLECPSGPAREMPTAWQEYWLACLAVSEISEVNPIYPGSWHVFTSSLTESQLEKVLDVIITEWGGITELNDPDLRPILNGGLVLISNNEVEIEPNCCGDLGDIANWKEAASFRRADWEMLWIGHPWLSMKYQEPMLILSDLHESNEPVERWAVNPEELQEAVNAAEEELLRFSTMIAQILKAWNYDGDATKTSMQFAGLDAARRF